MISIGITTFKRRLSSLESMIRYLKSCDKDIIINLAINGEISEEFDEQYRRGVLELCLKYTNIFPNFYQEFRSLSKLWNNLVLNSKTDYNLILNDDLVFDESQNFINIIKSIIQQNDHVKCFTLNSSWSHFVITKQLLDEMNYFDERFLLIGEEDGDFVWRYIEKYGSYPPTISIPIIANKHQTGVKDETTVAFDTELGYANKPKFNQEFTVTKYQFDPNAAISGMYGRPHKRVLSDEKQYPYESFYFKNKHNFKKLEKIIL